MGKKRSQLNSKLEEVAAGIEAAEGRKVELIRRRIICGSDTSATAGKDKCERAICK